MATSGGSAFSSKGKLVRQLAILHLMQMECIFKIIWLGNKDSRSLKCISMNSVHVLRSRVGMYDSKPKYFNEFCTCSSFSCWNVRFETEVCACSASASEAMVLIKEVGMVDSVTIFKSLRSNQEHHFTDFEVLDAKTATAPKKIIQNSSSKKGHTRGPESSFAGSISLRTSDCFYDLQVLPSCCF